MPTNPYVTKHIQPEQDLLHDLFIEAVQFGGYDVYYLPRNIVEEDRILNEDIESVFSSAYLVEMYPNNIDGFGGSGNLFQKFGLEIRDNATFLVSKRRWQELVGVSENAVNSERPTEGDLIFFPLSKSLFEITFVEHENPFYQLSDEIAYSIDVELFEYGGEKIDTGNDTIDMLIQPTTAELRLIVNNSNGTNFVQGEELVQGDVRGIMSEFTDINGTNFELMVSNWTNTDGGSDMFQAGQSISGSESGAIWDVVSVEHRDDGYSRNEDFDDAGDGIIDFTEDNPFGEL